MLAEADQVGQQAGVVQRPALVLDDHATPIRLPGNRAVGLEQVAVYGFFNHPLRAAAQQLWLRLCVVADGNVQRIDAQTGQRHHPLGLDLCQRAHLHPNRLARCRRQVLRQACLQLVEGGEDCLVQRVEVQLERLGLDDVGRIGRNGELTNRHHRLARRQQPAQLKAVPVIHTVPRQGLGGNTQLGPLGRTRDREQLLRGVGSDVFAGFAQRGVFGSGMHVN